MSWRFLSVGNPRMWFSPLPLLYLELMYYLFKKYSLNISARSIQVLTPIIQFDNSFTQTWKHLRHFFTIWMTGMTSWGKSHQKHDILSKFHGKYSNCGEATLVTIYHSHGGSQPEEKIEFSPVPDVFIKIPSIRRWNGMRRHRASSNCGKNPDVAWISRLFLESTLNGDPWTFYNPHVKAVWLCKIARNLVLKFSFKDMSRSNPNKDLRGHEET